MENDEAMRKGFNAGYILEQTDSDLALKIRQGIIESEDPYVQGFMAGCKEYSVEYARDKFKEQMREKQSGKKEREDKDRGADR